MDQNDPYDLAAYLHEALASLHNKESLNNDTVAAALSMLLVNCLAEMDTSRRECLILEIAQAAMDCDIERSPCNDPECDAHKDSATSRN